MSEIGNLRFLQARNTLSAEQFEIFKRLSNDEYYRLGREGISVPDLFDHCTEYAARTLEAQSKPTTMCDNTEYEEIIAAQEIMTNG